MEMMHSYMYESCKTTLQTVCGAVCGLVARVPYYDNKMGIVLIRLAWPKVFACVLRTLHYLYNPTIQKFLDLPLRYIGG